MESKQFVSEALNHSPQPNLIFQTDKFTRKNHFLNIPDTIHEQASAESSVDSLKMEATVLTKSFNSDEKENVNCNQQVTCNESSDNSKIITIDNSFIKKCERELLESSNSDAEKTVESESKTVVNKRLLEVPRLLNHNNESISTPPSALRKEISILRNELAAADEFHDLEIQVLKEEKSLVEVDLQNYLQVLEKNAQLMELYTALKNEYDEYRKEQENMRHELQSKTADCLESLCSQIEASDSSLNFSNASFVSFNAGIKSSTMLGDISEIEATVMHDGTVLASDPLSITCDGTFKTPLHTPMRSAKKLFTKELNSTIKTPVIKEVKEIIDKRENTIPLDSDQNIKLLNLEAALFDKEKELETLEQRLFKVEDMSEVLKTECERMRESLAKKSEQFNELTQRLFTETISLNPALRESLIDVSGVKLLIVFIETIMEKCQNVQNELIMKHNCEKIEWETQRKVESTAIENLQNQIKSLNEEISTQHSKLADLEDLKVNLERKLSDAENTILTREVEMRILQSTVRQTQEDFSSAAEALTKLESQLSESETQKKEIENRCKELEENIKNLTSELKAKEKFLPELDITKSALADIQKENEQLKQIIQQYEDTTARLELQTSQKLSDAENTILTQEEKIQNLQSQIKQTQEEYNTTSETLTKLQSQLTLTEAEKETLENRCQTLEETIKNLKEELETKEKTVSELQATASTVENVRKENEDLKQSIQQHEETISRIQSESLQKTEESHTKLIQEIESLKNKESSRFNSLFETLDECRRTLTDDVSSNQNSALESFLHKMHGCLDSQLLSAVEAIMNFVKMDWDAKRKLDLTTIETLQNQIETLNEKGIEYESKVTKIIEENNEFNRNCEELKQQLLDAQNIVSLRDEEITHVKQQEDILQQLKDDLLSLDNAETEDLYEKIEKLILQKSELSEGLKKETKIVSVFTESLTKTCKGIQNEYIKKIENKKLEWESQRNIDLDLINSLQNEVKIMTEKIHEQESKMAEVNAEKENLKILHENLTQQVTGVQSQLSTYNEEIQVLRSHETVLKQTKEQLTIADETIVTLKSESTKMESLKIELENRCLGLEETIAGMKLALDSNENLRSDLETAKSALEAALRENEKLKSSVDQSEKVIDCLKSESSQQNVELLKEIESLRSKESSRFTALFEILNDSKEKLKEISSDTENSAFELVLEKLKEKEDSQLLSAVEAVVNFVKVEWDAKRTDYLTRIENFENQIKILADKNNEYEVELSKILNEKLESDKLYQELKTQLHETESRLSLRDAEIVILKKQEDVLNEMKGAIALADETISKLNTQLSLVETEKKEMENQYEELKETVKKLQDELEIKEKLLPELQIASSAAEDIRKENENLKQIIQQSEETLTRLQAEFVQRKEELLEEIESLNSKEAFRSNILFDILEECKKTTDSFSSGGDNTALLTEKLRNCSDSKLSSAVEAIIEFIKTDWDSRRKIDLTAIENLQNQIKTFNSKSEELQEQLQEAQNVISLRNDEISHIRKQEDVLRRLKDDLSLLDEDGGDDFPCDKIENLVNKKPELQNGLETTKIVSVFVETLTKTCKGIQNEYIKRIESKKIEWESQHNVDLDKIDCLENKIKILTEKSHEQETKIAEINVEKEDLKKLHENLTHQIAEAQNVISTCNEEICTLRLQETTLKQTKEELAVANETIVSLKSKLESTESQTVEIELRCKKLEENTVRLKSEMDTQMTILQGLDELKLAKERIETENGELKQQIEQAEDVIHRLKNNLETAKEDEEEKEKKIKNLLEEIDLLKKEKDTLAEFSDKLEKLEKSHKNLTDVFSEVQSQLDLPEDVMTKLLSGSFENKKIFTEKMNNLVKTQTEGFQAENKNLKLSNENLKEKVKQLTQLLCETANSDVKEDPSNLNGSQVHSMNLRSRANKSVDLCVRRLDKLEEINHNLTELLTRILSMTEFPDLEKLKLCSVRDYPNITKKVVAHIANFESKLKELKEENAQLDEECETYSNIIKELKKDAATEWRTNKEKTEAMEKEIQRLQEEKNSLEKEKQDLLTKISKLEGESQKLKSAPKAEGPVHNCSCGNEFKKINELKRIILIKEQKLLELQDLEAQTTSYKSQIEYLKTALEREKKKVGDEKEKNKKLQNELNEATKGQKSEGKKLDDNEVLDELRMRGSISGGVVQEFVDKEKIRKLSKDIGILKEMCRARYAEIKRLEAVNASLRNSISKNSNQMDSPIRSRGYSTRSKNPMKDVWKAEINGKENSPA